MKFNIKYLIISLVFFNILFAQDNNGLVLLKMDVDARAFAMAGSYTAITNDAMASFYNPAGLANTSNATIVAMYNNSVFDISHSFAAAQLVHGEHNISLSFNYLQIPGIAIRGDVPTDNPVGTIDAFNLAAGLTYSTSINNWQVGVTLKYLFEKYYLTSAPGWAVDLGVMRKNIISDVDFGLVIQNLGKMSKLKNEESPLPLTIQAGFAYKVPNFFDDKLLLTPGLKWISKEQAYFALGSEFQIVDYLSLRAGIKNGVEELVWSLGAGISYKTFHFDYAYSPLEYDLGSASNMISFGFSY